MFKELFERSKANELLISKYNIYKGNKVIIQGNKGVITRVMSDMIRIDYDGGGYDAFYFDELEVNDYMVDR